jgi:hypothetical protein
MKKLGLLIAILMIAVLAFSGTAIASDNFSVKMKKGGNLFSLAKKYLGNGMDYDKIQALNPEIKDGKKIRVGTKIRIPKIAKKAAGFKKSVAKKAVRTVKVEKKNQEVSDLISQLFTNPQDVWNNLTIRNRVLKYQNPGRAKYKGDLETALRLLGYPEEAKKILKEKVANHEISGDHTLRNGDTGLMTYTSHKKHQSALSKVVIPEGRLLAVDAYEAEVDGVVYRLFRILWCGNWFRPPDERIVIPPEEKIPPMPPEVVVPPQVEEVPPIVEIPRQPEKPCCGPEHEPIIGLGGWQNGLAKGAFAYGEYILWLKTQCDSEYAYGIGGYGNWEWGESRVSPYNWEGWGLGPQVGMKRTWTYFDQDSQKNRMQQWVVKARFLYEETSGRNTDSGYNMTQHNFKVGLYGEYVRELNNRWNMITTGEAWYAPNSGIRSTWSGDKPSDRTWIGAGLYGQYKINDDWQVRFGGGPFYQGWDDLVGLHVRAEARWKEIVMIGPYANLYAWKSGTYSGVPLSDLQTYGAFIRIEFGPIIRNYDQKRRMERVKAIDYAELGITPQGVKN